MRNLKIRRIITISIVFIIVIFIVLTAILGNNEDNWERGEYNGSVYTHSELVSYRSILDGGAESTNLENDIVLKGIEYFSFVDDEFNEEVYETICDQMVGLYVPETGNLTYKVNVENSGYYSIKIKYYTIDGRSSSITKGIMINGVYQFQEATSFNLSRIWEDEFDVASKRVEGKHDQKPSSIEKQVWCEEPIEDINGYYNNPYLFYFNEGINEITLVGITEPVVINSISLYQYDKPVTYKEYATSHVNDKQVTNGNIVCKVQGEESYEHNQATLNPVASYTSYKIEPYEKFITRYNTIGGTQWTVVGDWISWEIEVPEDGMYELTFKVLQNYNRGLQSCRKLYINGEVPFEECSAITFNYDSDWQNVTIGNEEGSYKFYLHAGKNEVKLKNVIGSYANASRAVNETISDLNWIYRKTIMRTGVSPSKYQDYQIYESVPEMKDTIVRSIDNLEYAINEVIAIAGERSNYISALETTKSQLEDFIQSEKKLQVGLSGLESNITALGTWVMNISSQPLSIDYLMVHADNAELPKAKTNFFQKLWHEIVLLVGSFTSDTSLKSSVDVDGETITVWIMSGRDQANLLRGMIDESFTIQKNINVNLKLVSSAVLLKAVLSGNGPDVAIGVTSNIPVNWGIRNAVVDMSKLDGFEEYAQNFYDSAITPFEYNGTVYALPDTQEFQIQFVRNDIFNELGLADEKGNAIAPNTWDEVLDLLPTLQRQYLDYYLPNTRGSLSPLLYSMIVQNGGELYLDNGAKTGLLESNASEAFYDFVDFFNNYQFAVDASFTNRFRTGEMPIGVASFTLYNTLAVSAPEINGDWSFALLPGYEKDGVIDRSSASSSTGTIICSSSKYVNESWEFVKWWLGTDAQTSYAKGMESILGSAARYATANKNAFANLPWSAKEYKILEEQRQYAVGIPTVPGDYIVGRYIDNAFRNVLNENTNPSDALFNYCLKIDAELDRKQKELGLKK